MTQLATASLLPASPSFAGHQTFAFRSGWLKKGIDALTNPAVGGMTVFTRADALVALGVGKNMVQSIRHWLIATRMAEERTTQGSRELHPTLLGRAIFGDIDTDGWDPFLEDDATLWALHWLLAGPGSLAFTWAWVFNFIREYEFTRDNLTDWTLSGTNGRVTKPPARETIARDVDCLLHTYVPASGSNQTDDQLDCPLQTLGLLQPSFERHYRFNSGHKPTLPDEVFAFALAEYHAWKAGSAPTLSIWDITYAEGSPGQVFKLDEDSVLDYIDRLEECSEGAFRFEDTALTRQIVCSAEINPISLLRRRYHA